VVHNVKDLELLLMHNRYGESQQFRLVGLQPSDVGIPCFFGPCGQTISIFGTVADVCVCVFAASENMLLRLLTTCRL
jgi:hypothetical protein